MKNVEPSQENLSALQFYYILDTKFSFEIRRILDGTGRGLIEKGISAQLSHCCTSALRRKQDKINNTSDFNFNIFCNQYFR